MFWSALILTRILIELKRRDVESIVWKDILIDGMSSEYKRDKKWNEWGDDRTDAAKDRSKDNEESAVC